ncbi:hypothetical protein CEP53_002931 [Fusarium sp. AF-6]|nr:hypothetical protein CEP53_002931 [Fusarium sp. AF-6]
MTKVDPAVFGSSLPRADIKLLRQASASMAEPGKTSKIGERLTKEQLLKVQEVNAKRTLQPDVAQGFLGRHRESLQRAILDRVNEKDRAAFMDVLSKVPFGILSMIGLADSGKTDLMATIILLAMGIGPVIDILTDWARDKAQSTFLDETGAISMPETLVPWFDGRPLVLAGDVRQLPPCVMTLGQKSWTGGPLNFFDKHQDISVLERLMRMQWPCWSSQRQNRIVNGGFDLAREIFCPELGDEFEYGDQCAVSKRPGASQLESWPVFLNCLHTAVRTIDTSRVNYGRAEIALALMETLIKAQGTKFVVVSPYRATKAYPEGLFRQRLDKSTKDASLYKGLSNVQVSTAHSFQEKEADVAIFLTTVTQESRPGFVKDARRFNVGVTRHVDFLFVIGDIITMDPVKEIKEELMVSEQGGRVMTSGKKTRDAHQWLPEPEVIPAAPIQEEPTVSESKENATTTTTGYYSGSSGACVETEVPQVKQPEPQPEIIPQPEVAQPQVIQPQAIPPQEPELKIPSLPVQARSDVDGFVNISSVEVNTGTSTVADTSKDPFYETLKTVAQIDAKTLDIESPLVDDIGQFVSVTAGSLLRYVVGAQPISTGEKTRLPGVSERALLAEASLQAVLAIEQSSELNDIVDHMRQNWTANTPEVDQAATLILPYLKERVQHIAEYHSEDAIEQTVGSKKLKRKPVAIRLPGSEGSKDFAKGLVAPTLPLAGREQVFSSLGPVLRDAILAVETIVSQAGKAAINERVPKLLEKSRADNSTQSDLEAARILIQRAIMADAAYQALASLSEQKLQALKLLPLDSTTSEHESVFDFIKRIIQKTGPVALHPTKQAVKKFIPLLIDAPSKQPEPATSVTTKIKTTVHRLALRDVLREDKVSANVGTC